MLKELLQLKIENDTLQRQSIRNHEKKMKPSCKLALKPAHLAHIKGLLASLLLLPPLQPCLSPC